MDVQGLLKFDQTQLSDYLWRRLRLEPPVDPPLGWRFGDEFPHEFLLGATKQAVDPGFADRLLAAIRDNFARVARKCLDSKTTFDGDPVTDQQVAWLAFLVSELNASELCERLCLLAYGPLSRGDFPPDTLSFGATHVLRAMAQLQKPGLLAPVWRSLWERGPRSVRGLIMYAWTRADEEEALEHLAELLDMGGEIDLPATLWSLVGPDGPGIVGLGLASQGLSPESRRKACEALHEAGVAPLDLHEFETYSELFLDPSDTESLWLQAIVLDELDHVVAITNVNISEQDRVQIAGRYYDLLLTESDLLKLTKKPTKKRGHDAKDIRGKPGAAYAIQSAVADACAYARALVRLLPGKDIPPKLVKNVLWRILPRILGQADVRLRCSPSAIDGLFDCAQTGSVQAVETWLSVQAKEAEPVTKPDSKPRPTKHTLP